MKPRIGSIAHRDLFCKTFIATHVRFEPESLPWPKLEARYVDLLRAKLQNGNACSNST